MMAQHRPVQTAPKVHHLNCGTLRLPGSPMVCHVLLLEYADRLALIDTGFGTEDLLDPARRIGPMRHVIRPVLDPRETALSHIQRLGYLATDVRDILLTHMDIDHAGGVGDFRDATVHVTALEASGAIHEPSDFERKRYNRRQWASAREIVEHRPGTETWFGLEGVSDLGGIVPGVMLVPLAGHTRGHAGFAVTRGEGWLLHAGDAFYYERTIGGDGKTPLAARIQERLVAFDIAQLRASQRKLAALRHNHSADVDIICTHDPALFNRELARR